MRTLKSEISSIQNMKIDEMRDYIGGQINEGGIAEFRTIATAGKATGEFFVYVRDKIIDFFRTN